MHDGGSSLPSVVLAETLRRAAIGRRETRWPRESRITIRGGQAHKMLCKCFFQYIYSTTIAPVNTLPTNNAILPSISLLDPYPRKCCSPCRMEHFKTP